MSTLVVVGRDDEFIPVAAAERMTQLVPQTRLVVIDWCRPHAQLGTAS